MRVLRIEELHCDSYARKWVFENRKLLLMLVKGSLQAVGRKRTDYYRFVGGGGVILEAVNQFQRSAMYNL